MAADDVLSNPPCFRSGLLWGIGTGLAIGFQRYRMTKQVRTACDWAVLGFGTVAAGSWLLCRNAYLSRARYTREFMEVMNDPNRRLEAEEFLRSRIETHDSARDEKKQE
ncbi:hypothetical protein ATCC90586_000120 [Pythium insidiosum]|nr:hypothetical protein ATCC90586_000120 [Pythium insidiosum]